MPGRRAALARSWDLGRARPPERRSPVVIRLAQLPLRPLLALLCRPRWIGAEHLPERGGAVLCGNHQGPLDALAYGHLLQGLGIAPRFLGKEALFRVPVLGALLRASGQIPVHRGTRRGGDALSSAREAISLGAAVMVFPEGTYTRDPSVWPMRARTGAARLALESGAPLVPIAVTGSRALWPVGAALPRPRRGTGVVMRIGAPIRAVRQDGETVQQAAHRVTEQLMAAITELMALSRGEQPPMEPHDPRRDPLRPEAGRPLTPADRAELARRAARAQEQADAARTVGDGTRGTTEEEQR